MISHPLPRLLLPGANPVPSVRNGFVPFFFLPRKLLTLLAKPRPTQPPPPEMSRELSHGCLIRGDGLSEGPSWRESGFALRWLVPGARFVRWPRPWSSPPGEELEQQREGSWTEGVRPTAA